MWTCHHFPGGIIPEPDESHSGKLLKLPAAHLIFPFHLIIIKPLVGFVEAPGLLTRSLLPKPKVSMVHRLMVSAPGLGWPSWPSCSTWRDSAATLFPWCLQKGLTCPELHVPDPAPSPGEPTEASAKLHQGWAAAVIPQMC